jgi:hypothetical protein
VSEWFARTTKKNHMKTITKFISFGFASLALECFTLSPRAQAVVPAPDGGYPGGNTAEGTAALQDLTHGTFNTAVGNFSLTLNKFGEKNTAVGASSLRNNDGDENTAVGVDALNRNQIGSTNTAVGVRALFANTTGLDNTAIGVNALLRNTTGDENTAIGLDALESNSTGVNNTAIGVRALLRNTNGKFNTANGSDALRRNTTGETNTAIGSGALFGNTTGDNNTAIGSGALLGNTIGDNNTATGYTALDSNTTGIRNTAMGYSALNNNTTGSNNIAIGPQAGGGLTTGSYNIDIGAYGAPGESNTIRIGSSTTPATAVFIQGISGQTQPGGLPVTVASGGRLGTVTSSARYKEGIKPMDKASEAILSLQPVTFRYKKELDPKAIPQFGLVAEQVEKVNPDLVAYDDQGKPYTVRYEAVNAMLLNEFLKEHHQVQDLKAIVAEQQKQIEALIAGLQKVSAQLELNKPAPQTVLNSQ